jgi:hypothetical protein
MGNALCPPTRFCVGSTPLLPLPLLLPASLLPTPLLLLPLPAPLPAQSRWWCCMV